LTTYNWNISQTDYETANGFIITAHWRNMIKLELSIEEVNGILQTLGQLPTSSGAWPLVVKIKEQAESQVPQDQAPGE
jgi:hypothetical protein